MTETKLQELQDRVIRWRNLTLDDHTLEGAVKHLVEEAKDLIKNPRDPYSLADLLILLVSIAEYGSDMSADELVEAAFAKQTINESRDWGTPDEQGIIRHIESTKI